MLLSPLQLHHDLQALTSPTAGPHTALLILPQGRLLCSASRYDETFTGDENENENENEEENEDEQPYLEEPERLRLLCGLASQWEEDDSSKIECEVSVDSLPLINSSHIER